MKAPASEPSVRRRDPVMVLIADHLDQRRTLYVESLLFHSDYRIVEATDARGLFERARRLRPRVVVMPLALPDIEANVAVIHRLKDDPTRRELHIIGVAERDRPRAESERFAAELRVDVLVQEPCLPAEVLEHIRSCVRAGPRPDSGTHAAAARADRKRPSERDLKKAPRARDPRERDPKTSD